MPGNQQTRTQSRLKRMLIYSVSGLAVICAVYGAGYGVYSLGFRKGVEKTLTNDMATSRAQVDAIRNKRAYHTRINSDKIDDLILLEGDQKSYALIGMPDGTYKMLETVQEEERKAFESGQADARKKLETTQKAEQERAKGEAEKITRRYAPRSPK
jgi:hypothetical protein